jgi:hypothetical protein
MSVQTLVSRLDSRVRVFFILTYCFQKQHQKLKNRIDAMYVDKLDGEVLSGVLRQEKHGMPNRAG